MDLEFLHKVKKQIESTKCFECQTNLKLKSIELEEKFQFEKGASFVVDTYCKYCNTYPAVIMQINT